MEVREESHPLTHSLTRPHPSHSLRSLSLSCLLAANNIPHGIEEMAWDAYLNNVGWSLLLPKVLFSVHRSLLAGRNTKKGDDPFAGIAVSLDHSRWSGDGPTNC